MTTTVLAYFPSPGQGVWHLGPIPIRAYALCIIAGIIAALVIGDRRWAARGGERGVVYDVALWAVPFGLVGGRLYHVITDWKTYFGPGGAGVGAAARIWEGGLGIWGAVFLGGVGAWIACRRKGIPLPAFGDAVAPGIVLAQAIGRLGNYFNQELYGRETSVPWGLEIFLRRDASGAVNVHSLDGVSTGQVAAVVHPTFLYEMLWNLLVFVLLLWADRKFRLGHGRLFALYVAAYCVGRFWVELMRDDTATHIAGIRINVFTATFVFIGAVVYMLLAPKGREDPASLRGRQPVEAHQESRVEEWAEDLVAVATGGGIVAAATVAGEHEAEDAEAVGDIDGEGGGEGAAMFVADGDSEAAQDADADAAEEAVGVAESEVLPSVAAVGGVGDEPASSEPETFETEDVTDAEGEQAEQDVADRADTAIVPAEVAAETAAEVVAEADTAADADQATVMVYEDTSVGSDLVMAYESAVAEPLPTEVVDAVKKADETSAVLGGEVAGEAGETEPEPQAVTAPAVAETAVAETAVAETAVAETAVAETAVAETAVAETETPRQSGGRDDTEPDRDETEPDRDETEPDGEEPRLGSVIRRLLWGAGSRGRG